MSALWMWHPGAAVAPAGTCLGWTDAPLVDRAAAKVDAGYLAERIGEASAIWCSDLKRARQAARPLAKLLGLNLQVTPALREINFGDWEGRSWAEIRKKWPDEHAKYIADWDTAKMPGGESYEEMRARVLNWWNEEQIVERMVIVAHAGPLRALAGSLLRWTPADEMAVTLARGHCALLDRTGKRGPGWNFPPKPGGAD